MLHTQSSDVQKKINCTYIFCWYPGWCVNKMSKNEFCSCCQVKKILVMMIDWTLFIITLKNIKGDVYHSFLELIQSIHFSEILSLPSFQLVCLMLSKYTTHKLSAVWCSCWVIEFLGWRKRNLHHRSLPIQN